VKRSEHLIADGLIASAVAGIVAVAILWIVGRSGDSDWPAIAAFEHPVWLAIGEIVGAAAFIMAVAFLAATAIVYGRSSALATFGVICLGIAAPGIVLILVLDLGYVRAQQDGILNAIQFGQHWNWWSAVGWFLFAVGGLLGLLTLGIGLARANRGLRYPGLALAVSVVLLAILDPLAYGGILFAVALVWMAAVLWRGDFQTTRPSRDPYLAR
jgi:hypothetical protein